MAKKKAGIDQKAVPIEWHIPDTIITRFATNMVVQTIENEFKVLFFELKAPFLLTPQQAHPDVIPADCVASVIITADRLPKFIEVLQRQLAQYNENKQTNKT